MGKPILLDFTATWCGPCRMQKPILDKLEKEFGDRVEIKGIDVDQNQELAAKYSIRVVPTLVMEKDDVEARRFTGVTQGNVLSAEFNKLL
ncbi:MAG TPA: redoxin domain-containing protein [Methanosarcinaceae archaeon]|nr:redoxin domain-containing protein [Methanosarcinaceae archaeon]